MVDTLTAKVLPEEETPQGRAAGMAEAEKNIRDILKEMPVSARMAGKGAPKVVEQLRGELQKEMERFNRLSKLAVSDTATAEQPTSNTSLKAEPMPGLAEYLNGGASVFNAPVPMEGLHESLGVPQIPPAQPPQATLAPAPTPASFASNPGGAATGRVLPSRTLAPPTSEIGIGGPRTLLEGGLSTIGSIAGSRVAGPFGDAAGGAAGAFGGSLLSEVFDPTKHPLQTATEAALSTAGMSVAGTAGMAGLRRLIGKPNEAGDWLIAVSEKNGTMPLPGAVIPDSAMLSTAQSIAKADVYFGKQVSDALARTGGQLTDEIRSYITSYQRTKLEATKNFKQWDDMVSRTLGNDGVVNIGVDTSNVISDIVKGWVNKGLAPKLDNGLVRKITDAERINTEAKGNLNDLKRLTAGTAGITVVGDKAVPVLSISEARAAEDLLYNSSREAAASTAAQGKTLGGSSYADAYRSYARDVDGATKKAIDDAVKDGRMPADARARLQGAEDLWKRWKTGEVLIDNFKLRLESAGRESIPLSSRDVFAALDDIAKQGDKINRKLITGQQEHYLSMIGRALEQNEKSGATRNFSLFVRGSQLGGLGLALTGYGTIPGIFMAVAPSTLSWILTNKEAASLLIRGLQSTPGTAAAAQLTRNFATLMMENNIIPPDRDFVARKAREGAAAEAKMRAARPEFFGASQ